MINREVLIISVQKKLQESNYSSLNLLNHPVLQPDEYNSLAHYSQQDDIECRHLLYACSGRLIHKVVSGYIHNDDDSAWTYDDLMQCGFMGIGYALENWKQEEGIFTSYSVYYIQREINKQIHALSNMIFVNDPHRATLASKLTHLQDLCELEFGHEVSNEVFADWLNKNGHSKNVKNGKITADDIFKMTEVQVSVSLDSRITSDEGNVTTLLNTLADQESVIPISEIINQEVQNERKLLVKKLLESLTDKQKIIVELYYGFDNAAFCVSAGRPTFASIARVLEKRDEDSWNPTRCIRIHQRAIKRMRKIIFKLYKEFEYKYV